MASSKTRITPNSFLTKVGSSKDGGPILVYFVPGNPGVVSYYHYFLSLVASNLSSSASSSEAFASLAAEQLQKKTGSGSENRSGSSTPTGHSIPSDGDEEEDGEQEARNQSTKPHTPRVRLPIPRRKSSKKHRKHQRQGSGEENKSDHDSLSSRKKDLWNYPNTNNDESYLIAGRSLAGFEIEDDTSYLSSYLSTFNAAMDTTTTAAYSLDDQVQHVERNLAKFVRKYQDKVTTAATAVAMATGQEKVTRRPRPKVILMGHSMGSYITMEILRRRREREITRAAVKAEKNSETSSNRNNSEDDEDVEMDIIGALMLFPTVVDIAKSPSGKRMTTLGYIPYLDLITSLAVKGILSVMPATMLRRWVRHAMRNPPEDAVDTTIAFLKSKTGIRQSLSLAAEEMQQIGPDKWSDEIWGISEQHQPSDDVKSDLTKLIFYFGRNDHWVAERTRDEIIQARSAKGTCGPKMLVCDDGIEHGFCIRHNEIMADKVSGFIREVVNDYRARQ